MGEKFVVMSFALLGLAKKDVSVRGVAVIGGMVGPADILCSGFVRCDKRRDSSATPVGSSVSSGTFLCIEVPRALYFP